MLFGIPRKFKCFCSAEYGAFWKCVTAGFVYMITQLVKMLFLATFFPTSDDDDDLFYDKEIPFEAVTVRHKTSVDNIRKNKITPQDCNQR